MNDMPTKKDLFRERLHEFLLREMPDLPVFVVWKDEDGKQQNFIFRTHSIDLYHGFIAKCRT